MNRTLITILIVVLIVLAIWLIFFNKNDQEGKNTDNTTNINTPIQQDEGIDNSTNDDTVTTLGTEEITMESSQFSRSSITIKRGTSVKWTNNDGMQHTVTSVTGNELNSGLLSDGASYEHTFNTIGTFNYFCELHTGMTGVVVVIE